MLRLEIQPIPVSSWGKSLANRLDKSDWNEIRFRVYREANYKCQICKGGKDTLHCHELWAFNDKAKIQRLVGFECCCQLCHDVHHFGRSTQVYPADYVKRLIEHWCKVNGKTKSQFLAYERRIAERNRKRANIYYLVKVGRRILR